MPKIGVWLHVFSGDFSHLSHFTHFGWERRRELNLNNENSGDHMQTYDRSDQISSNFVSILLSVVQRTASAIKHPLENFALHSLLFLKGVNDSSDCLAIFSLVFSIIRIRIFVWLTNKIFWIIQRLFVVNNSRWCHEIDRWYVVFFN